MPTRTRPLTTRTAIPASGEAPQRAPGLPRQGLPDTSIVVLRRRVDPAGLPDEMAISAITLAELSAGPHQVRPDSEQDLHDEHEERARRTEAAQRADSDFDPVPSGAEAARIYGRVTAAVAAADRTPRRRIAGLMIAATAIAEGLPLVTTNPGDHAGPGKLLRIVPVTLPPVPHEKTLRPRLPARGSARAGGRAVPRRYSSWATGCSAAWLARLLWVPRGVLSNLTAVAALTWAFDARGCKFLTAR